MRKLMAVVAVLGLSTAVFAQEVTKLTMASPGIAPTNVIQTGAPRSGKAVYDNTAVISYVTYSSSGGHFQTKNGSYVYDRYELAQTQGTGGAGVNMNGFSFAVYGPGAPAGTVTIGFYGRPGLAGPAGTAAFLGAYNVAVSATAPGTVRIVDIKIATPLLIGQNTLGTGGAGVVQMTNEYQTNGYGVVLAYDPTVGTNNFSNAWINYDSAPIHDPDGTGPLPATSPTFHGWWFGPVDSRGGADVAGRIQVPEPTSALVLLAGGALAMLRRRR